MKRMERLKNSNLDFSMVGDMFEVSREDLRKVLVDFYNLTKFKIVLYDSDRNVQDSYPEHMCNFCKMVRTNDTLAKKCISCDNIGFDICDETRKPYIYECHMSVFEAIAPIYSNGINVGYLMFGQILGMDHEKVRTVAQKMNEKYCLGLTEEMIAEMTAADEEYIKSAVNMMSMCANYLYTNEIIRNNPDILAYQLKEYLKSHLDSEISVDDICRHFYISRTKLYKISVENFNMGISDYIRALRMERAKKLIRNTRDSIAQIAAAVGIRDTNYFIKVFKKAEGITPLQYRKIGARN